MTVHSAAARLGADNDRLQNEIVRLRAIISKVPQVHTSDCRLGPHDPDARCSCWVADTRYVLGQ